MAALEDVEETRPHRGLNAYTVMLLLVAVLGGLIFGLDIGTGAVTSMDSFRETMGIPTLTSGDKGAASTTAQINEFAYIFHATCFIGAPFGGYMSDRIGRKPVIWIASFIFIVGSLWQCLAGLISVSFAWKSVMIGRAIGGIGLGFMLTTVPVYTAELMPAKWRGRSITIFQLSITIGIFVMALYNEFMTVSWAWRLGIAIQIFPCVLTIFLMMFIFPESPRYLIKAGRDEEAKEALHRLAHGMSQNDVIVTSEMEEIKDALQLKERYGEGSIFELFQGENLVCLLCAGGIAFSQDVTGINWFINYATALFESLGFDAFEYDLILKGINVGATLIAIPLIDHVGRKPLAVWGTTLTIASFFLIALVISATGVDMNTSGASGITYGVQLFSIIIIFIFQAVYATTWGPLGWIVPAEVFSLRVRGIGMSVCVSLNFLSNILLGDVGYVRIYTGTSLQVACFVVAALNLIIAYPVVTLFQPETRGLRLEDLRKVFAYEKGGNPIEGYGTIHEFMARNLKQTRQVYTCRPADRTLGLDRVRQYDMESEL